MELPVLDFRSSKTGIQGFIMYIIIALLMLVTFTNCQNATTENLDNINVTKAENLDNINVTKAENLDNINVTKTAMSSNSSRDTNVVTSLLQTALSGNLAIFDALNTSKQEPSHDGKVTMAPTHFPAINMSQSTWRISPHPHSDMKQDSQSVPIAGLPIPLSLIGDGHPKIDPLKSSNETLQESNSQKTLPPIADIKPKTDGIYIPMHKLLRDKRQASQQAIGRGHQRVMTLINPTMSPNQRATQRVHFLTRQPNHPLYNITFANSTGVRDSWQRTGHGRSARPISRNPVTPGKQAVQNLSDLNLVNLTFPLIARNDKVSPAQSNSRAAQASNTHSHINSGSDNTGNQNTGSQNTGSQNTGSQNTGNHNTGSHNTGNHNTGSHNTGSHNTGSLNTRSHNTRSHSSSNSTSSSSSTTTSSHSNRDIGRQNLHNPVRHSNGTATGGLLNNQRRRSQFHITQPQRRQNSQPPSRQTSRLLNFRRQNSHPTPPSNTAPTQGTRQPNTAQRQGTRQLINRPGGERPTTRLTFVQPVSGQRISSTRRIIPTSSRTGSRTPQTAGRSSRTGGRTLVLARANTSLRQPVRSASRPRSRTVSSVTSLRRSTPQRRRTVVPARRRAPPDPFTQRFSAGFQRGSSLLHQPPMDFTGFDGTRRDNLGNTLQGDIGGFPGPPGFGNNMPFPGMGPGMFGGPGMFLGGPPGFF